jgi:uncharacterized hydrophobic protein (TIGR00271 family)
MMVRLRVVAPPDYALQVQQQIDRFPTARNVIRMPGAATRPDGDVFLCDVPREAASMLVADLRGLGVPDHGSISLQEIDFELSHEAEIAEALAPGDPGNAVVWEQVEQLTNESSELTPSFLVFMAIATMIAACGIFLNAPILIVGAMVIGPEFGPLAGLCVATVQRRRALAWRSLRALALGFPVAITAAYLASLAFKATGVTPDSFNEADHPLATLISSPDFFSFFVAFCAGIVGMLSLTTSKSSVLVGVLISVTTIPAAANIGVAAAYGEWSEWRGSMAQLAVNLLMLFTAGVLTLAAQRAIFRRNQRAHEAQRTG